MASLTEEYVDRLRDELAFDPEMRERMCEEVAAHLEDALAASPDTGVAAERRVLDRFGGPGEIGRSLAEAALGERLRSTWSWAVTAMLVVFVAMRFRNSVFSASDDAGLLALAVSVDRYAFAAAIVSCLVGWLLMRPRGIVVQARGAVAPLAAGAAALAVSVIAGMVVASQAAERPDTMAFVVPLLVAVAEIVIIVLLLAHLRALFLQIDFLARSERTRQS